MDGHTERVVLQRMRPARRLLACIGCEGLGKRKVGSLPYTEWNGRIERPSPKETSHEPDSIVSLHRPGHPQAHGGLLRTEPTWPCRKSGNARGMQTRVGDLCQRASVRLRGRHGSDDVHRMDLRRAGALCRRTARRPSPAAQRADQEQKRSRGRAHVGQPAAGRTVSVVLHGVARGARTAARAAPPQLHGPASHPDEEPGRYHIDGGGRGVCQVQATRQALLLRAAGQPRGGACVRRPFVAHEPSAQGGAQVAGVRRNARLLPKRRRPPCGVLPPTSFTQATHSRQHPTHRPAKLLPSSQLPVSSKKFNPIQRQTARFAS